MITGTEGVTASFVRELVRRAVIARLPETPAGERVVLTEQHLIDALAGLRGQSQALTRSILGGSGNPAGFSPSPVPRDVWASDGR